MDIDDRGNKIIGNVKALFGNNIKFSSMEKFEFLMEFNKKKTKNRFVHFI